MGLYHDVFGDPKRLWGLPLNRDKKHSIFYMLQRKGNSLVVHITKSLIIELTSI